MSRGDGRFVFLNQGEKVELILHWCFFTPDDRLALIFYEFGSDFVLNAKLCIDKSA